MIDVDIRRVGLSMHSIEAYRRFYPDAEARDLLLAIDAGVEIDAAAAAGVLGRRQQEAESVDRYVLHPERTGIFVLSLHRSHSPHWDLYCVTFLRFYGLAQHLTCARLWPGGAQVTAIASWAQVASPERVADPVTGNELQGDLERLVGHRVRTKLPGGLPALDEAVRAGRVTRSGHVWTIAWGDGDTVVVVPNSKHPAKSWTAKIAPKS